MKRAEHQPVETEIAIYAGIFAKLWRVPDAGTLLPQHAHDYDHLTLVMSGAIRVWCGTGPSGNDELMGECGAPSCLRIPAGAYHKFLTLTDNVTLACIHNADRLDANEEPSVAGIQKIEFED